MSLSTSSRASDRRYQLYIGAAATFLVLYYLLVSHASSAVIRLRKAHSYDTKFDTVNFADSLLDALAVHAPDIPPIRPTSNASALVYWKASPTTPRPDLIPLSVDQILLLKEAHNGFRETVVDGEIPVPYTKGARGIVSTASGALIPVLVVSLRMLRRTGCTLPVEVLLRTPEEEPHLCDVILPSMNARCIFLSDYLGSRAQATSGFQFKIFAVLFSQFENVLFLDADCFPVVDPSPLIESPKSPLKAGLVTWPDFWASTASPHLFEIQSLPIPPVDLRPSTESGQLLVSKSTHAEALLMAAYYNYHGPDYYFLLLGQGAPGTGDKETWLAASEALDARSYQVKAAVDTMGYYEGPNQTGQYHGVAMVQYDPQADDGARPPGTEKRAMFVHHNFPKPDPVILFSKEPGTHGEGAAVAALEPAEYRRLWGPEDLTMKRFGRDVEDEMWQEIEYLTCRLGRVFEGWKADSPSAANDDGDGNMCDLVKQYRRDVFGHV